MESRKAADVDIRLLHSLLDDFLHLTTSKQLLNNKQTLSHRTIHEGNSFLSKTLPTLAKALEKGLDTSHFQCPTNFWRPKRGALPALFGDLLRNVFDVKTGHLLECPCAESIYAIRQICYFLYKEEKEFTPFQQRKAEEKFVKVDNALPDLSNISVRTDYILFLAAELIGDLFKSDFDDFYNIKPRVGPGIVAGGELPHEKFDFNVHYKEIHNEFPYYRYFTLSPVFLRCAPDYWSRIRKKVGKNKVLFVPKDSRGPRTIACEPNEYMWIQQGVMASLVDRIENHSLTKGQINFTKQEINQELARVNSISRKMSTVDLKDASDSVSTNLVDRLFEFAPTVLRKLNAIRTPYSVLPSGNIHTLKKFCAMGSAICFPLEAICFWSIAKACILYTKAQRSVLASESVYVYGDDIIIDKNVLPLLTATFAEVGITINQDKSFSEGFFRESCGHDYYKGIQINPLRLRRKDPRTEQGLVSLVELANNLRERFLHNTASVVEKILLHYRNIPEGYKNSPYLCFYSSRFAPSMMTGQKVRWNKSFQYLERRVPVVNSGVYTHFSSCDRQELLRKMTIGLSEDFRSHIYGKPRDIGVRLKWIEVGT